MIRDVSVLVKCDTHFEIVFFWKLPQIRTSNFRKVVRQHIKGTARNIIRLLLEIYFSFQRLKNFENPLRIDTIIAMSLVYYFFGTQCVIIFDCEFSTRCWSYK